MLQGLSGAVSRLFQKSTGLLSTTVGHTFYATFLIGIVQAVAGGTIARRQGHPLLTDGPSIRGAIWFGVLAVISTVLSFLTFLYHGQVGVATFIVTLSIVPGAIIDWLWFKHQLTPLQLTGVGLAILAGYAVLNGPSLNELLAMPLWVWLALANAVTVAINQGISQSIKTIDPFVKNFWVGCTTVVLAGAGVLALGSLDALRTYPALLPLTGVSLIIGCIVVVYICCNILAFRDGAYITAKKLVFNGSWLVLTMLGGALFFGEALTPGQFLGIGLFLGAFWFMQGKPKSHTT